MNKPQPSFRHDVFINCPFDKEYLPLFRAIVFTIHMLDFLPRCSQEMGAGDDRLTKLIALIGSCKYGVHDLSRIQSDHRLPRFNMPFELGIDIGFKNSGNGRYRTKRLLVMDSYPYRYRRFISDLSGRESQAHYNRPRKVIEIVRNWLNDVKDPKRDRLPGANLINREYEIFCSHFPAMCKEADVPKNKITFTDYSFMCAKFIDERKKAA